MQTEVTTSVTRSMSELGQWFATNQPRLFTALALIAVGAVLAVLLRAVSVRLVIAIERAMPGHDFRTSFAGITRERHAAHIVGAVAFWAVLLFFLGTAADALGLPLLSEAVATLSAFVPRVLGAALILVIGLMIGNVARGTAMVAATRTGTAFAPALGQIVRIVIIAASTMIAVAELGVDITLLTATFSVALAAMLGGFAIAFGLGARTAISNIIGSHYLRESYEVGQLVRVGGIEGTIAELTSTAVMLNVPDGRMAIPAKQFSEMPSMLVVKGGAR